VSRVEPDARLERCDTFFWSPRKNQNCALYRMRGGQVGTDRQGATGLGQTAFKVAGSVNFVSKARSGLGIGAIESDRPASQRNGGSQRLAEAAPVKIGRTALGCGETLAASGKARVEIDGLLKVLLGKRVVLVTGFAQMP
jgi:hypothetical protein